jgi:hypothetical protein
MKGPDERGREDSKIARISDDLETPKFEDAAPPPYPGCQRFSYFRLIPENLWQPGYPPPP